MKQDALGYVVYANAYQAMLKPEHVHIPDGHSKDGPDQCTSRGLSLLYESNTKSSFC